jgi:hypothetical protein
MSRWCHLWYFSKFQERIRKFGISHHDYLRKLEIQNSVKCHVIKLISYTDLVQFLSVDSCTSIGITKYFLQRNYSICSRCRNSWKRIFTCFYFSYIYLCEFPNFWISEFLPWNFRWLSVRLSNFWISGVSTEFRSFSFLYIFWHG